MSDWAHVRIQQENVRVKVVMMLLISGGTGNIKIYLVGKGKEEANKDVNLERQRDSRASGSEDRPHMSQARDGKRLSQSSYVLCPSSSLRRRPPLPECFPEMFLLLWVRPTSYVKVKWQSMLSPLCWLAAVVVNKARIETWSKIKWTPLRYSYVWLWRWLNCCRLN